MLPLWIINLEQDKVSEQKLESLLRRLSPSLKPFWQYSHLTFRDISDGEAFQQLKDQLIKEGQDCHNRFMTAGLRVINFQIAVLGAANEQLSQCVFAAMPGIIRSILPRVVSEHENRGVVVTGLLFIPSTANQEIDVNRRERMAVFLEEVNLLSRGAAFASFDNLVAYQEIQHQACRFYGSLSGQDRTELLFQYITTLFLGSYDSQTFFARTDSEGGIYALGAASAYYDKRNHRDQEMEALLDALIAEFKDKGNRDESYSISQVTSLIESSPLSPEDYAERLREGCAGIKVNLLKMEGVPDPHPVWDFLKVDLFPSYYRKYLRYMPARLMRFMGELSYALLSRYSVIIRNNRGEAIKGGVFLLRNAAAKMFTDAANPYATLAQIESFYAKARERFDEFRASETLAYADIIPVPHYLKADYERCLAETDPDGDQVDILDKLKKYLRKEPVTLSLVVRCFFLGVLLVFIAVPVLQVLYPSMIPYGWIWIPLLFLLPLAVEFLGNVRRHFKRINRLKYRLLATTLRSVNRKLFIELTGSVKKVYDGLIAECESQLERLDSFRGLLSVPPVEDGNLFLPRTRFNQPLFEGTFQNQKMVVDSNSEESRIRLSSDEKRLSELEKGDYLQLIQAIFHNPMAPMKFNISESSDLPADASRLVEEFRSGLSSRLLSMEDGDIAAVLNRLGQKADLEPLKNMAGLNGMLLGDITGSDIVVKSSEGLIPGFDGALTINDPALAGYVMISTLKRLPSGLSTAQICSCAIPDSLVPLFSDKLALYFAYYREQNGAYLIGNVRVPVEKTEMEAIGKMIKD